MSEPFQKLFEPGKIGSLEIKNRIIKAPTSSGMSNMDGSVSERLLAHYKELAIGGTGLVIVEYAYIDNDASKSAHCQLGISTDEHIPGLAWLAHTLQDNGAKAGIQIEHCGRQKFLGTAPIKAPSAVPWEELYANIGTRAIPQELTIEEIYEIIDSFGEAAYRAQLAGFDLVEIHGAHGYLVTNFLSPRTNKRNDLFGGSLENRMRFLIEAAKNIRCKVDEDFPVTVRLSGTDYEPDGIGIEDTIAVCKELEKLGLQAIHVSGGDHHLMQHQVTPMGIARGNNVWAAEAVKKEVCIPVIASGSLTLPDFAEEVLAKGKADFISLGRPLFADPHWANKAKEGRAEDIIPCIRCNEGCLAGGFLKYRAVECSVNPTLGREREFKITPAPQPKKIAIIGGGPAGMEAARVSALRGHQVTLYEKRKLGGLLHEASIPEFKEDIRYLINYLSEQIYKSEIEVIEKEATIEDLKSKNYDAIVVATGSNIFIPQIPGYDKNIVVSALDVLNGHVEVGKDIIVVGAGLIGTEVAIVLAEKGLKVRIIKMREGDIMQDVVFTDKIVYGEKIAKNNIEIYVGQKILSIEDSGIVIENRKTFEINTLSADTVVMALGLQSNNLLTEKIKNEINTNVLSIGDCVQPGKIWGAIRSGFLTGFNL